MQLGERQAVDICSENPRSTASNWHSVKEHVGGRATVPRKEVSSQGRLGAAYPEEILNCRYTIERQDLVERYLIGIFEKEAAKPVLIRRRVKNIRARLRQRGGARAWAAVCAARVSGRLGGASHTISPRRVLDVSSGADFVVVAGRGAMRIERGRAGGESSNRASPAGFGRARARRTGDSGRIDNLRRCGGRPDDRNMRARRGQGGRRASTDVGSARIGPRARASQTVGAGGVDNLSRRRGLPNEWKLRASRGQGGRSRASTDVGYSPIGPRADASRSISGGGVDNLSRRRGLPNEWNIRARGRRRARVGAAGRIDNFRRLGGCPTYRNIRAGVRRRRRARPCIAVSSRQIGRRRARASVAVRAGGIYEASSSARLIVGLRIVVVMIERHDNRSLVNAFSTVLKRRSRFY